MTMEEIRSLTSKHIPSAKVVRKLFWRYLLVWEKEKIAKTLKIGLIFILTMRYFIHLSCIIGEEEIK